jgi:DNA polymerase/3'-5' exonuclease PolX
MKLRTLQPLAQALLEQLASACVRIEIAGSVRRGKPDPHDLDLVAIPMLGEFTVRNLCGEVTAAYTIHHLDDTLGTLIQAGEWEYDPDLKRDGPKYKRLRHVGTPVCCDLSITDSRRWGMKVTLRTGPADFSKALVSGAHRRGMFVSDGLLHAHTPRYNDKRRVLPCPQGETCPFIRETPEEIDVFDALGIPWIEPGKRNANLLYSVWQGASWREEH